MVQYRLALEAANRRAEFKVSDVWEMHELDELEFPVGVAARFANSELWIKRDLGAPDDTAFNQAGSPTS
ncbi:MAG: hypothetical protein R3A47_04705 [Polyangiales bacterium]